MAKVLALQDLSSFLNDEDFAGSNVSAGCSSTSSGQGHSSCSNNCEEDDGLNW
jgi:hypothetical protein